MEDKEIQDALDAVCNVGPYDFDFAQSNYQVQVYRCRACGAEVRLGTTASHPTWAHYKPGHEAATGKVPPALDEDRVRTLIAEAIEAAEDRLVERVFTMLNDRLRIQRMNARTLL